MKNDYFSPLYGKFLGKKWKKVFKKFDSIDFFTSELKFYRKYQKTHFLLTLKSVVLTRLNCDRINPYRGW